MNAPPPDATDQRGRLAELAANPYAQRAGILILLSVLASVLMVDFVRVPTKSYAVGDVADRDIRAATSYEYVDWEETAALEKAAMDAELPVFDYDSALAGRLNARLGEAFDAARRQHAAVLMAAKAEDRAELSDAELSAIAGEFLRLVELSLDAEDLQRLIDARWDRGIEDLARRLLTSTMRSYIVTERSVLPDRADALRVRTVQAGRDSAEKTLESLDDVRTPAEARQQVSLLALESGDADDEAVKAAVALARAAVRPNLSYNQYETLKRREDAQQRVGQAVVPVARGTALARQGDVLTRQQVERIRALQDSRTGSALLATVFSLIALTALLWVALYQFGANWVRRFSTEPRDLGAGAALAVLALLLGRIFVELSDPVSSAVGLGLTATSLYYVAPFAGSAMLMRILVGAETTLVWVLGGAALLGIMMDQSVLFAMYFAVSGLTAAGALGTLRERAGVLRAGVLAGLVNAAAALLLNLVQAHLGGATTLLVSQPLWDVGFAFCGGVLSGVLVLGVVPIFEAFGFVTDYKLLELANLNHPLLRQLMLRAPGTYHHSVTVAQLCEAAAEAIDANALQTRVACYFHDIGKAVQPRYFIENQRGGPNPHDKLPPHTSARVIINHVTDGEAIAKQYKLPKPILDGITMHHGSGLIQYFYAKALEQAKPGEVVDEGDFRYPGSPPDSRETGIMMLADKVEAACRTLKDKSPENIRGLIQKLVNGAILDGQLEQCPLTVKELYTIVDAFTNTLQGIYHHRIEYPGLPKRPTTSSGADERSTGPIITLEMANPLREAGEATDPGATEVGPGSYTDPNLGDVADPTTPPPPRTLRPEDDYESAVHQSDPSAFRDDDER